MMRLIFKGRCTCYINIVTMQGVDQPVHLKNLPKRGLMDSKSNRCTHECRKKSHRKKSHGKKSQIWVGKKVTGKKVTKKNMLFLNFLLGIKIYIFKITIIITLCFVWTDF